jgi:hypothetical protein
MALSGDALGSLDIAPDGSIPPSEGEERGFSIRSIGRQLGGSDVSKAALQDLSGRAC